MVSPYGSNDFSKPLINVKQHKKASVGAFFISSFYQKKEIFPEYIADFRENYR